jgi:hypothetical protein
LFAALWLTGCGPFATFRPASTFMGGGTKEIGLGAATVSPRRYVDEPWLEAGQLWFSGKATPWLTLSGIAAFDPKAIGVGGGATFLLVRADRFAGGLEGELGYGWGAAGVPVAIRIFEQNWIYGTPRVANFGIYPTLELPVGVSAHLHRGAFLRLEYQSSWAQFDRFNQRNHLGAALAVQW